MWNIKAVRLIIQSGEAIIEKRKNGCNLGYVGDIDFIFHVQKPSGVCAKFEVSKKQDYPQTMMLDKDSDNNNTWWEIHDCVGFVAFMTNKPINSGSHKPQSGIN